MSKHDGWAGTHQMANQVPDGDSRTCFCIGPQNGEPLCPCGMRVQRSEEHKFLAKIMKDYDLFPKRSNAND